MQPIEHVATAQVPSSAHTGGRLTVWSATYRRDPLAVRLDFAPIAA
jgi:hypothetical protein